MSNTEQHSLLWVAHGREGYGVATTVIDQSRCLRKRGWAVTAICFVDGEFVKSLRAASIDVHCLGLEHAPKMLSGGLLKRLKIYRVMQKTNSEAVATALQLLPETGISVVATCTPVYLNVVARLAKAKHGLALWRMASSVQRRPFLLDYRRWILQWQCWRGGVLAMANSEYTAASLRNGPAMVRANLHGCDSERFSNCLNPYSRAQLGLADDAKTFAIVGRFDETGDKGQLRFIQALQSLGSELLMEHNVHLLLVGGPTDSGFAQQLESAGDSKALRGRVHTLGFVRNTEAYYGAIDVAVNVRLSAEPFGLSVIEAMMAGTPVLAHSLGGPAETIVDGKTGWLIDKVDVQTLSAGIRRVLEDWNELSCYSKAARHHALSNFTLEHEVQRWLALVERAKPLSLDS